MPLAMGALNLARRTILDATVRPAVARKNRLQNTALTRALVGAALVLSALGCGAVSTQQSLGDAQKQIDEARKLEGEEFAPYEYTRATSYFQKAKQLTGEGMFEQAAEYAKLAQLAAEKAQDVARLGKERKLRLQKFAPKEPAAPKAPAVPAPPAAPAPPAPQGGK